MKKPEVEIVRDWADEIGALLDVEGPKARITLPLDVLQAVIRKCDKYEQTVNKLEEMTDRYWSLEMMREMYDVQGDWDRLCEYAEDKLPPLHDHLEMWGASMGAPQNVYRGHLVRMLLDITK